MVGDGAVKRFLKYLVNKIDSSETISAIRRGFIMVIPILMIGAFSRIMISFPINSYQKFIESAFSGAFLSMLTFLYDATLGILSLYIVFSITTYYLKSKRLSDNYVFVGSITAVVSFFVLSGVRISDIHIEALGLQSMFTAIFSAVVVSRLFFEIIKNFKLPFRLYADGVDLEFNDAIIAMIPCITIVILFTFLNYMVCQIFNVESFQEFYVHIVSAILEGRGRTFVNGFMFTVISSVLCFFGIYGNEVLDSVSDTIFAPVCDRVPVEVLSKEFFDVFVLIGGCGTCICLLITIFVFSKRKINKNLARISAIPMLFNINEILAFGYPVIFNPYLLAPFIVTPSVAYCVSYLAMYYGIVPKATHTVAETVPIFISGYKATGSVMGIILQLLIVVLGICIYLPFVKMYDKSRSRHEASRMKKLTNILKKAEEDKEEVQLLNLPGGAGDLAKCLAADIDDAINHEEISLYYQLQYDNNYQCIGAETLLRYNHPIHGFIYPPMIIKLSEEYGILGKLERQLFIEAAKDYRKIKDITNRSYKISVNVTISTILEKDFISFLADLKRDYNILDHEMCIEITEQMAIKSDSEFEKALREVKKLGYMIAIDDFSMGSTSIKYLQKNQFDMVKLDGSIVKEMMSNERSRDIISSIVYLAHSLNFSVLAEYVETEEEIEELKKIGCNYYQGYHFSKAVGIEEFLEELKQNKQDRGKNE